MEPKRVVVTGLGLITSLGDSVETYWNGLVNGESGVGPITLFDTTDFETKFAGQVQDFDPTKYLDRKEARQWDRFAQFAVAAAQQAIEDSRLNLDDEDLTRIGVVVASGIGGMATYEKQCNILFERGPSRISPFFIPMMIADIAPGLISMKYGFKGVNYSTTSACASASHAIGDAFMHIRNGHADCIVTGGSEAPLTPMGVAGFNAMKALSTRNDNPEGASRPFDLNRDGFVPAEGSAILILEELGRAKARNARIYAEMIGFGFTADAHHITAPAPGGEGAARAMQIAITGAGLTPDQVDYINAHGTSTDANDRNETDAIKTVFGDYAKDVAISSTKSMIGHLLGASGAVEAVATIMTINHNMVHPTINYETPDPECDLNYTPNKAVPHKVQVAISNSFGFGGHNVCLAFKKYAE
ncbi:beta-ketoacyl-ACP synthase II [candidate division KSB1 bacterium]|nr:beta-ketoacyl-ACP synthase II [candidate division KSB1 bacterium]